MFYFLPNLIYGACYWFTSQAWGDVSFRSWWPYPHTGNWGHNDRFPAASYYRETTQSMRATSRCGLRRRDMIEKNYVDMIQMLPTEIIIKWTAPVLECLGIIYIQKNLPVYLKKGDTLSLCWSWSSTSDAGSGN